MSKKSLSSIITIVMLIIMGGSPVLAGDVVQLEPLTPAPSAETGEMTNETSQLWFVELKSNPTADGTSPATVRAEKAAFRQNARRANLAYTERYAFDTLFNGLSISIEPSQLGKLTRIAGVKNIYPVDLVSIPATEAGNPDLFSALEMSGASIAQSELGYTGAGVKVAVMDSGVDYDHLALGGDGTARSNSSFFPNARVAYGYDFVGDAFNADPASPTYNPVPTPDAYPDDCDGHGTHVAGIIGADDPTSDLVGVAPAVTLGAYRVFGCEGSTTADIMLLAMEAALADGMQVLNMSIGSSFQWPQYPTAMAATYLVNRGMVVVASIGNSGASGLYAAGAPGLGEKVIGVASFNNTDVMLPFFTISPDNTPIGYTTAAAAPTPPTAGTFPLARTGTPTTTNDACNPLAPGSLAGQIALIRRGTCSFYQKAFNAQTAGAIGVVLYNNAAGRFSPTVAGSPAIIIPVVAISNTEGALIDGRLALGPVDLTWTADLSSFPNSPALAGLISDFSSYGLSPDLALKPDIGAPGGSIWSTFPLELGGYANLSGTSMSSPHVAGAVALLLEARPNTPSQAVRGILQNSADPAAWWGNPALGFLDNVHRQGAGMLDIDDAILSTTKIEPAKISAGESQAGPYTQLLTLENNSDSAVTYDLSHTPALATGPNTFVPAFLTGFADVTFSAASVTVPAGGTASVSVTIAANPGLPDLSQYGGYVVFTPQGGGQTYRVPYAGLKGDYQSKQVLGPGTDPFPALGYTANGASFGLAAAGRVYNMVGFNIPYFLVHLDHQAAALRVELFSSTGRAWHRAYNETYLGRNSTSTGFFALPFDGVTFAGNRTYQLSDGSYYAVLSVLKANGDSSNPADWETWTSPLFVIDRP